MKMKIVVMRDIKADLWGNPIFVQSLGGAIRGFQDEIAKTDGNALALHPEDYELYHLGDYDVETGNFELMAIRAQIAVGSNFKK